MTSSPFARRAVSRALCALSLVLVPLAAPVAAQQQQCPGYPKTGIPGCGINLSVTRNPDTTVTIAPGGAFAGTGGMVVYFAGLSHNPDPVPNPQANILDPVFNRPCCPGGLVYVPACLIIIGFSGQAPLVTQPVPPINPDIVMIQGVIFRPVFPFTPCDYYLTNACCFPVW